MSDILETQYSWWMSNKNQANFNDKPKKKK